MREQNLSRRSIEVGAFVKIFGCGIGDGPPDQSPAPLLSLARACKEGQRALAATWSMAAMKPASSPQLSLPVKKAAALIVLETSLGYPATQLATLVRFSDDTLKCAEFVREAVEKDTARRELETK